MTTPDWRDELGHEIDAANRQLDAVNNPVALALSETIGRLRPGDDMTRVGAALVELAERATVFSALDRELAKRAAVERLRELGVPDPRSLVAAAFHSTNGKRDAAQLTGAALAFTDPEPWGEPVDGAELLAAMCGFQRRFTVVPAGAGETLSAFALLTHVSDAFPTTAYVALESPTPECGKTRVLEVLNLLVRRPWFTLMPSTAVLFRVLEQYHPTMLLDECQAIRDPEAAQNLRDILAGGYKRGVTVPRCVGDQHEVRHFDVFAPKVFALIGTVPGALATRCIRIPMRRRRRDEQVERFRPRLVEPEALILARQARRWAADHWEALSVTYPEMPSFIEDRLEEIWGPLFAVGLVAGGDWYDRLVAAAKQLVGNRPDIDVGEMLLSDLWTLFDDRQVDRLPTATVIEYLITLQHRSWPEWSHGKPLSARGLAKLLARFEIEPQRWRDGADNPRGYSRDQFADAWSRYLSGTSGTSGTAKSNNDLRVPDVPDVPDNLGPSPRASAEPPPGAGDAWEVA